MELYNVLLVDDEAQERDGIRFLIEKYRLTFFRQ